MDRRELEAAVNQSPLFVDVREDILPLSVGVDAGLALKTRKGTGLYKVPSLRGVWYRRLYFHNGSIASLEHMVDPKRLCDGQTSIDRISKDAVRC
jgi:cytochrome c peroxidase